MTDLAGEPDAPAHHRLLRILGVGFGVAVGVGSIIGSGVLRAPSTVAGEAPGVALIMALWLVGAIQASLSANMVAELGAALPKSGGPYVIAHHVYGDVGGLVVGWSDWLATIAAIAAGSVSFSEFLPLIVPAAGEHKIAIAVALQLAMYTANIAGVREGRAIQMVTSAIKAGMLFLFILAAVLVAAPPEPKTALAASPMWSWGALVLAYKLVAGAYGGWTTPLAFSGENIAPGRNIPRAMFIGIALTAVLYLGVNAALLHALGVAGGRSSPLPFAVVIGRLGGALPSLLFALTALITVASCANANAMAGSRTLFALAQDHLLPRGLGWVNNGGSPVPAFILSAVVSIALAMTGAFGLVFGLIATLNTANSVLLEIGFFILRRR